MLIVIGLILWAVGINPLELLSEGSFPQVPQMPAASSRPDRQASRRASARTSRAFPADAPCTARTT